MSLKTPERAVQKTMRCYGGDCSLLLDVCRDAIVFDRVCDLRAMLQWLHQDPEVVIVRIKNRLDPEYDPSLSAGYRDLMINLQIRNEETVRLNVQHHIVELQLIPRQVYDRRQDGDTGGHRNYVLWRNLRGE